MTKAVALVQARMGSTRLPGKVLKDMAGEPLLGRVLDRVELAHRVAKVVVATSVLPADDAVAEYAGRRGLDVVRGSEQDVLGRFQQAALAHPCAIYLRVSGDCPLLSPAVIDGVIALLPGADYASTSFEPRTFPLGLDVEAFTAQALATADREDGNPAWREHVTTYILRHPEKFRMRSLHCATDLSAHRWTVDTAADFELCRRIWQHFGARRFTTEDVLDLLRQHPQWSRLNAGASQKEAPP